MRASPAGPAAAEELRRVSARGHDNVDAAVVPDGQGRNGQHHVAIDGLRHHHRADEFRIDGGDCLLDSLHICVQFDPDILPVHIHVQDRWALCEIKRLELPAGELPTSTAILDELLLVPVGLPLL